MIWILGEYAERIENVDELLESFLDNFNDEPQVVQMQLLTAIVKLFLKKPQSTQDMVSKVLKFATEDSGNHDIRDRGYIYWRLLSTNPEATKHVVLGDKPGIRDDSQVLDKGLLDKLVDDLALMSSVYHKPKDEFVTRMAASAAPVEQEEREEGDEEVDEDDRKATRREMQQELERGPEERNTGASNAGGGALDLLDLGGGDEPASAMPPASVKVPALSSSQAGQGGKTGFGVMTALVRQGGTVNLQMTMSNSSQQPLNGFAIQVNKNPFGFGPQAALQVPDLAAGSTVEVVLPMAAGTLSSNTAPTNPLFLQVAVKNSMDIFYFNVPFDLGACLTEGGALAREQFSQIWQRVGEGRQNTVVVNVERPLNADAARSRLATVNVHYVAQRAVDADTTLIYTSAMTSNNCAILAEISVGSNSSVKIATRTETPVLVPLFEAAVGKVLGAR